ncbi:hypothetical protein AcW1_005639 [Taiwanofungus camphoratus]|nr:hypothetical protein AcW2_004404 [Antrodia cinnamomea]KAI0933163.1 hypothetical protein AcV7_004717 [Antrodia cinnamomea]KAI0957161.1 hypothetical protein AcW1_005639 [Antrodia cinnamomea]
MVSPVATPVPQPHACAQHQYGTRIRSNSVIRPSARLRQSPDFPAPPRRIRPVPTSKSKSVAVIADAPKPDISPFPPEHVMLHSEDVNSKVFLAIGRSFMSVDNRAMTIKDLAEMTMKFGLMCQNVSAAGQAITTYIRNHLQRCEVQQDHPLLLRHVLSGTASDDELVPALHSRVGGAHCTLGPSDNRITNFRRGTMVWYLSKAAGAPCPFARAGIRLSDYSENGKVGSAPNHGRERKRERDRLRRAEQCGHKRKRLLRACADKGSDSDSLGEEEKRPPKVKLTLRLRPSLVTASSALSPAASVQSDPSHGSQPHEVIDLSKDSDSDSNSDSESDSMSVDSLPSNTEKSPDGSASALSDYPSRSISIPSSTPSIDELYSDFAPHPPRMNYRRSPSVPFSTTSASPPPDSEFEDDDFHISMIGMRRLSDYAHSLTRDDADDDMGWDDDFFGDFDGDTETQWESPGPRSPSVQFEDEDVVVKQEPSDVRGLLDAWEDMESIAADMKVVDVIAQAAAGLNSELTRPKLEDDPVSMFSDNFGSSSTSNFPSSPEDNRSAFVKEEECEPVDLFSADMHFTPPRPYSSPSPNSSPVLTSALPTPSEELVEARRQSELLWRDVELLGPDSVTPHDLEDGVWQDGRRSRDHVADQPAAARISNHSSSRMSAASVGADTSTQPQTRVPLLSPRLGLTTSGARQEGECHLLPDLSSPSLISSLTSLSIRSPAPEALESDPSGHISPPEATKAANTLRSESWLQQDETIVISSRPGGPTISLTQLEGILVYQVTLDSSLILRRADTHFVNVSPIIKFLELHCPRLPDAVIVGRGSTAVCGSWVPLAIAQDLSRSHPDLSDFLSDELPQRFPPQFHCIHDTSSRAPGDFGLHFQSTIDAKRRSISPPRLELLAREEGAPWERGMVSHWDIEDHLISVHPQFALTSAVFPTSAASPEDEVVDEGPLSPTEEEMFRVLCSNPDWETSAPVASVATSSQNIESPGETAKDSACRDRPLRRSKRVANAVANRSRTRSTKRGSRSSLS